MKYREHAIQEAQRLNETVLDFLAAWLELLALFQLMDQNGFTKEQRGEILEAALKVVMEEAPGEEVQEAAERVKELLEA